MDNDLELLRARIVELERQNTDLKKEVRRREVMYSTLVEDQRELICRIAPDGTLAFVNDAYCRFFNKTRDELVGKHFTPLIPDEDQPIIAEVFAKLGPKEPIVQCEHRVLKHDGEIRWINWIDRTLMDDAGNVIEYQAVGIDVTDRRQAVEHLERNELLREQLIHAQDQVLRELAAPVIPIADDVLAMPLVGRIDEKRSQLVLQTLLEAVVANAAETVLLDVTGIAMIDTQIAEALVRTAQAVRLLGARVVLTGIQPHVAQTLVSMGVGVQGVITLRTLKEGIAWAMQSSSKVKTPVKPRHASRL